MVWGTIHTQDYFRVGYAQYWTGSEIWGYKSFNKIYAIQNKAIRIYLGVHRFAPTAAVSGDIGWTHSSVRRKVCMKL